jgi:hypothetical protein
MADKSVSKDSQDIQEDSKADKNEANTNGLIQSGMFSGKNYAELDDEEKQQLADDDSGVIQKHHEIVSHPPRHQMAQQHMQGKLDATSAALEHSKKMKSTVGKGLKNAFGGGMSESPFQKSLGPKKD